MKIIYRIYGDWTKQQAMVLKSFGIDVELGAFSFDIEDGELYNTLNEKYLKKWKVERSVSTIYDKNDISKSSLLVYFSTWVNGYPQPEDIISYRKLTYNLDNYCQICGIGSVQNSPFRLKQPPKWGHRSLFELNWVYDEIFVRRDIYDSIFMGLGLDFWPVLLFKNDQVITDTVQLKLPVTNIPLLLNDQEFEICGNCGRKKYNPQVKGYFPGLRNEIPANVKMFKSCEYFGGGGVAADRRILIKKEVLDKLWKYKIKPVVWPVSNDVGNGSN